MIETGRLTGVHWWDEDARRHRADAPRFCCSCGACIEGSAGVVVEYWTAEQRVFHCWCRECGWAGDVLRVERMIGYEAS